jgi:hypothetical protein
MAIHKKNSKGREKIPAFDRIIEKGLKVKDGYWEQEP